MVDQFQDILKTFMWVGPLLVALLAIKLGMNYMLLKVVFGILVCMGAMLFWWRQQGRRMAGVR